MVEKMMNGNYFFSRILIALKEIDVHLFLQEAREEMNLEYKWRNPMSDEDMYKRE